MDNYIGRQTASREPRLGVSFRVVDHVFFQCLIDDAADLKIPRFEIIESGHAIAMGCLRDDFLAVGAKHNICGEWMRPMYLCPHLIHDGSYCVYLDLRFDE